MKGRIWVVIHSGHDVEAILAAEALRKAAHEAGREIGGIGLSTGVGVLTPLGGSPVSGDQLLLVGPEATLPTGFEQISPVRVSLRDVLNEPNNILEQLSVGTAPLETQEATGRKPVFIVAVTSCPTGIAHTFMAAEGLQKSAEALGYEIRVETQGSVGAGTPLTPDEIHRADLVMIAADREVDRSRFAGKRVYASECLTEN